MGCAGGIREAGAEISFFVWLKDQGLTIYHYFYAVTVAKSDHSGLEIYFLVFISNGQNKWFGHK